MNPLATVLVTIYEVSDVYPAAECGLRMAAELGSRLVFAGVVRTSPFIRAPAGPPGAATAVIDHEELDRLRRGLRERIEALAAEAERRGGRAERLLIEEPCVRLLATLTRRADLVIESRPHRCTFVQRLVGDGDLYTDGCCPVLVAGPAPFSWEPMLLVYNDTSQANRGLRWVEALAGAGVIRKLNVLVLHARAEERDRLCGEVASRAQSRGLEAEIRSAGEKDGFRRTAEEARRLGGGVVAAPSFAFKRPLRLRLHGIDAKAVEELKASVLIFPKQRH